MKRYTFDEIKKLDQALHQLAIYEITHGRIIIPQDIEEAIVLQEKAASKFNEFKRLIQEGDCTFEFIKNMVLAQNGPIPKHEWQVNDVDSILERPLSDLSFHEFPFQNVLEDNEEDNAINGFLRGVMLTLREAVQRDIETDKKKQIDTTTDITTTKEPTENEQS